MYVEKNTFLKNNIPVYYLSKNVFNAYHLGVDVGMQNEMQTVYKHFCLLSKIAYMGRKLIEMLMNAIRWRCTSLTLLLALQQVTPQNAILIFWNFVKNNEAKYRN